MIGCVARRDVPNYEIVLPFLAVVGMPSKDAAAGIHSQLQEITACLAGVSLPRDYLNKKRCNNGAEFLASPLIGIVQVRPAWCIWSDFET